MGKKNWFDKRLNPTTRSRSNKQESGIAKDLFGKTTVNSGATFRQNDIETDWCSVEAKTTSKDSYRLTTSEWKQTERRTKLGKIPIFMIQFETTKKNLAVMNYDDLKYLIQLANGHSK